MRFILAFIIGLLVGKYGLSSTVHKTADATRTVIGAGEKAADAAEATTKKVKDTSKDIQDKIK